jgi:hypothetical protein
LRDEEGGKAGRRGTDYDEREHGRRIVTLPTISAK